MCRLLGISINKNAQPNFSLHKFRKLGASNPDGWGIAYWDNNQRKMNWHRSKEEATIDPEYQEIMEIQTKSLIAHVRRATDPQERAVEFSHPYYHKIGDFHFAFAHNGERSNKKILIEKSLPEFRPSGRRYTDSEAAFAFIMTRLKNNIEDLNFNDYERVVDVLRDSIQEMEDIEVKGSFNFLLMINETIYARKDDRMVYSIRDPSVSRKYGDTVFDMIMKGKLERDERSIVVSSMDIDIETDYYTGEEWSELANDSITVLRDGRVVFSTDPTITIQEPTLLQLIIKKAPEELIGTETAVVSDELAGDGELYLEIGGEEQPIDVISIGSKKFRRYILQYPRVTTSVRRNESILMSKTLREKINREVGDTIIIKKYKKR